MLYWTLLEREIGLSIDLDVAVVVGAPRVGMFCGDRY